MPTVGEQLRAAREAQDLSVEQVADATKIRTDHLRALEAGDYTVFPAPIYLRGSVRNYASLVKLDVPALLSQLDAEVESDKQRRDSPGGGGHRGGALDALMLQLSRINWRAGLWLGALVFIAAAGFGGYRAWQRHITSDPLQDLGPGLYEPGQSNRGELLPLPPSDR